VDKRVPFYDFENCYILQVDHSGDYEEITKGLIMRQHSDSLYEHEVLGDGVTFNIKKVDIKTWILWVDFHGKVFAEIINHDTLLEMYMNINVIKDGISKLIEDKRKSILLMDDESEIVSKLSKNLVREMRET